MKEQCANKFFEFMDNMKVNKEMSKIYFHLIEWKTLKPECLRKAKELNWVIEKRTLNKVFLSIFKIKAHKCQYKVKI